MANNCEKLGVLTPDHLIASTLLELLTGSGTVAAGAGALKRGTVLALTENGKLTPMTAGLTPYGILCDDVNAADADTVVEVYLTGCFNKGALTAAKGYELTAADIQALRNGGIFVENVVD